jgi:hypothetical protein
MWQMVAYIIDGSSTELRRLDPHEFVEGGLFQGHLGAIRKAAQIRCSLPEASRCTLCLVQVGLLADRRCDGSKLVCW